MYARLLRVMWISIHLRLLCVYFDPKKILKGSLQSKLKGASVWLFNACSKVATDSEFVIYDVIDDGDIWSLEKRDVPVGPTVQWKLIKSTAVITRAIFTCLLGPDFRFDLYSSRCRGSHDGAVDKAGYLGTSKMQKSSARGRLVIYWYGAKLKLPI